MQEPAQSYPAAVEESKQEDAQEWADSAAVDMSSEVGMHISNDVKCEYKLANEKCAPKLGDELVLDRCSLEGLMQVLLSQAATVCVCVYECVCACMRLILSPYLSLTFYQNILQAFAFPA
jgi:hypothetical protein